MTKHKDPRAIGGVLQGHAGSATKMAQALVQQPEGCYFWMSPMDRQPNPHRAARSHGYHSADGAMRAKKCGGPPRHVLHEVESSHGLMSILLNHGRLTGRGARSRQIRETHRQGNPQPESCLICGTACRKAWPGRAWWNGPDVEGHPRDAG